MVPRWVQLVGLPLLVVLVWLFLNAASHVVYLFIVAGLIALLLDPLVRALQAIRLPRGLSVAVEPLVRSLLSLAPIVLGRGWIASLDLNPVIVRHGSVVVLDAKIHSRS